MDAEETWALVCGMVLPLRECTLGPKMSSAAKILALAGDGTIQQ